LKYRSFKNIKKTKGLLNIQVNHRFERSLIILGSFSRFGFSRFISLLLLQKNVVHLLRNSNFTSDNQKEQLILATIKNK